MTNFAGFDMRIRRMVGPTEVLMVFDDGVVGGTLIKIGSTFDSNFYLVSPPARNIGAVRAFG